MIFETRLKCILISFYNGYFEIPEDERDWIAGSLLIDVTTISFLSHTVTFSIGFFFKPSLDPCYATFLQCEVKLATLVVTINIKVNE